MRGTRQWWSLSGGQARRLVLFALAAFALGYTQLVQGLDDTARYSRLRLWDKPVSGKIVFVTLDNRAIDGSQRWPWPRALQAQLIERLVAAGASRVAMDLTYDFPTDTANDRALHDTLLRHHNVWVGTRATGDAGSRVDPSARIMPFGDTRMAAIDVRFDRMGIVWNYQGAWTTQRGDLPAMGSVLAGTNAPSQPFGIDYHFDIDSVPRIAAADVMAGRLAPGALAGKAVIVGLDSDMLGDRFPFPLHGRDAGALNHLLAAETLMAGKAGAWDYRPALALAIAALWLGAITRRPRVAGAIGVGAALVIVGGAAWLEMHGVLLDIAAGLVLLAMVAASALWRRYRLRGFVNETSGLPNFHALRLRARHDDRPLVVARLTNHAQLAAQVSGEEEKELNAQIVNRLSLAARGDELFHGEDGLFAWQLERSVTIANHLDALSALFRPPARVGQRSFDLPIAFGVEIGSKRPIANRLGSAVAAAEQAGATGEKWHCHDPFDDEGGEWQLSVLSELDQALSRGDVWLAYQPQVDLGSGRWRGVEALARWTHPARGAIMPGDFIRAAEKSDRIDELTLYVLDKAIGAAARLNRDHGELQMAVNLSAKTLRRRTLPDEIAAMLDEHRLDPARLTIELTETAAIASEADGLEMLHALSALGVELSIDDYGTGLSTLDYLKKVPAAEIKIDQSFVKDMLVDRSDLLLVQSTIALAHALGRRVVAEGIEDQATLARLTEMGCDRGQGYHIARPMDLDLLARRLTRKGTAAKAAPARYG